MLLCSNKVAKGKSDPNSFSIFTISVTAIIEWPPISKNHPGFQFCQLLKWMTRYQRVFSLYLSLAPHTSFEKDDVRFVGSGKAFRSTLLLAVKGSLSKVTNADGTMYSGNFSFKKRLSSVSFRPAALSITQYATNVFSPCSSVRATTAFSLIPLNWEMADSFHLARSGIPGSLPVNQSCSDT